MPCLVSHLICNFPVYTYRNKYVNVYTNILCVSVCRYVCKRWPKIFSRLIVCVVDVIREHSDSFVQVTVFQAGVPSSRQMFRGLFHLITSAFSSNRHYFFSSFQILNTFFGGQSSKCIYFYTKSSSSINTVGNAYGYRANVEANGKTAGPFCNHK